MKKHHWSIRTRVLVPLFTGFFIIAVAFVLISYFAFRHFIINDRLSYAYGLTHLIANELDAERIDDYIELGHDCPGYDDIEAHLYRLRDAYHDIQYIYVYQIREDGCHVVFDLDTEAVPGADPGFIEPFDPAFQDRLPDLLAGREIEPVISRDQYGYLLTVYTPVYDSRGECKCYVAVDDNMDLLQAFVMTVIQQILYFFLLVVVIIIVVSVLVTDRGIVKPMDKLEEKAYRDPLTGLKNRTAYSEYARTLDERIAEGNADFALLMVDVNFLKRVNDTYGHEKGNEYLKNSAGLIAGGFGEERVYRTGGDEFVVLLDGDVRKEAERMIRWFRDMMKVLESNDNLQPWQKVSAALGCATYERGRDSSAAEVLKRADAAMYQDKLAMKAQRRD